jgi:hypothetical protein
VQAKLVRAVLNRVGKLLGIGVQWGTDLDTRASQVVDDDRGGFPVTPIRIPPLALIT